MNSTPSTSPPTAHVRGVEFTAHTGNVLDSEVWCGRIFAGDWREGAGGDVAVVEPATGAELGRVGMAGVEDLVTSAAQAAGAQREWAQVPFQERAAVLRRAGDALQQHTDELRDWLVRETGGIPGKAYFELQMAAQECYEAAALPSRAPGELLPSWPPRLSMARRVPVGVVGVITPFNAPLVLAMRSVAPALALGNAAVLKPDPRTAVCGGVVLARVFELAGLPPGVLHVLPGGAELGAALVADAHVRVISFTGSTTAGRAVGELAGRHLKRAHLELGGNSALIVLDDADLEQAVGAAAFGSFFHQGQACMAIGRHLVQDSIYPQYVQRLAAKADGLPVGDPATGQVALGPIIDAAQRDRVHQLVTSSVAAGARLAAGGTYQELFYRPTVLADAGPSIPAYEQEVFGPVAPVTRFATRGDIPRYPL
jgi:benzaldehyde dehydrogenase (NAD)